MSIQPLIDRSQLNSDITIGLGPNSIGSNGQVLTVVSGIPAWQTFSGTSLATLTDVTLTSPGNGQVLTFNGTDWVNATPSNSGTVTSIAAVGSTGLVVTGSPITLSGTLTLTLGTELQGLSTLAANGFVQRTGAGTYTSANLTSGQVTTALGFTPYNATNPFGFITGNQTITLTGAVTGSGSTSIVTTLAVTGVTPGTYNNVTVNARGLVNAGSNIAYLTTNQAITVSGDVTGSGTTTIPLTLATVNTNVGTFGSATAIPTFTVNAKGLITAAATVALTRPLFTATTQGEVPASGGGTTNFLRADGTWSPAGGGGGSGTVTSIAATGSTGLTVGGSPITTSGTLTFTLGTELQGLSGLGFTGIVNRTGVGTYAAATTANINTLIGYTPVAPGTVLAVAGGALTGGGTITAVPSTLTITLNAFNGTSKGYVPTNSVVTSVQFLRDDGTWATPPGSVTSVAASGGTTGMSFTGSPITSSGTLTLTGTLAVANGGTGQVTAAAAINALVPSQTGQSGNFLTTNGTVVSWAAGGGGGGGVTSFNTRTGVVTLNSTDVTSALTYTPLQNNQIISLTGDATGSSLGGGGNSIPVTLATVNATVGTFGDSVNSSTVTVNAKGLVTAIANTAISASGIGAALISGSNATGTWPINISGNSATTTTANALNTGNNYQVNCLGVGTAPNGTVGDITASRAGGASGVIFFGTSGVRYLFYDGTNYNLNVAGLIVGGTVTAPSFNSTSDINAKTNVTKIDNALNIITNLNGVRFNWKSDGAASAGLIAQEVEAVMPELVATNEAGTKSMNYNGIVGALVEAVKEMNMKLAAQDARINELLALLKG